MPNQRNDIVGPKKKQIIRHSSHIPRSDKKGDAKAKTLGKPVERFSHSSSIRMTPISTSEVRFRKQKNKRLIMRDPQHERNVSKGPEGQKSTS